MATKPAVVKVLAWRNPGPLGGDPRWDLEVVRANDVRERVVGVDEGNVRKLLDIAEKVTLTRAHFDAIKGKAKEQYLRSRKKGKE